MELDILFLGGLYPKEEENEVFDNSKYSFQAAANELQWGIVKGLDTNMPDSIKVLNSMYVGSWPFRYKKPIIKSSNFSIDSSSNNTSINVGFLNLYGFTDYTRYISLKPYLKKWANQGQKKKVIIAYGLTKPFINALMYAKNINQNITTCIIVPDLPQYTNTSRKTRLAGTFSRKTNYNYLQEKIKYVDSYVLLTDYMKTSLGVENNYTVVEGMVSSHNRNFEVKQKSGKEKIILYTGVLHARYGILSLLKAFTSIQDNNFKLIICGFGDSEEEIKKIAEEDKRVEFKGLLRHKEILKLQQLATVLINPRQNNEEFTKFSFPSKTLEYLISGTPMIAYKLDGIPDEYDEHIFYVPNNSVKALKDKIIEVCEKDQKELDEFGEEARKFVLEQKNNVVQTKKIIELVLKPC